MIFISSQNYTKVHQIVPSFVKFALVLYIKSTVRHSDPYFHIYEEGHQQAFQDVEKLGLQVPCPEPMNPTLSHVPLYSATPRKFQTL